VALNDCDLDGFVANYGGVRDSFDQFRIEWIRAEMCFVFAVKAGVAPSTFIASTRHHPMNPFNQL
jgi:hypothetical protein